MTKRLNLYSFVEIEKRKMRTFLNFKNIYFKAAEAPERFLAKKPHKIMFIFGWNIIFFLSKKNASILITRLACWKLESDC